MEQIATVTFVTILLGLSIFQIILALGYPFGEFAWGGQHKVLPKYLKIGSVFSVFLYFLFIAIFLSKSGSVQLITNESVLNFSFTAVTVYSLVGIFVNAISRSKKERFVMTPLVAMLALCCLVVGW